MKKILFNLLFISISLITYSQSISLSDDISEKGGIGKKGLFASKKNTKSQTQIDKEKSDSTVIANAEKAISREAPNDTKDFIMRQILCFLFKKARFIPE